MSASGMAEINSCRRVSREDGLASSSYASCGESVCWVGVTSRVSKFEKKFEKFSATCPLCPLPQR